MYDPSQTPDFVGLAMGIFGIAVLIGAYFLPTFIAVAMRTRDRGLIFFVNLIAGWSGLGWLGCLFWAVAGAKDRK